MKFSIYGAFIVVSIILISIFIHYIYGVNLKYKYSGIKTSISSNSVKISSEYAISKNKKIKFEMNKDDFWKSKFKKNLVRVNTKSFSSNSIFHMVNTLFWTSLALKDRNNALVIKLMKLTNFFIYINLIWTLIFSFWIVSITLGSISILNIIINIIYSQKDINKSYYETKYLLTELRGASKDETKLIKKYLKYKKLFILSEQTQVFFKSFVDLYYQFKMWGKNE